MQMGSFSVDLCTAVPPRRLSSGTSSPAQAVYRYKTSPTTEMPYPLSWEPVTVPPKTATLAPISAMSLIVPPMLIASEPTRRMSASEKQLRAKASDALASRCIG